MPVLVGLRVALVVVMLVATSRLAPAEWTPGHDHIVVGGNLADRARALTAHLHGVAQSRHSDGDWLPGVPAYRCHEVHVLAIGKPGAAAAAVLGVGISFVAVSGQPALVPGDQGRLEANLPAPYASVILDTSPPPPRSI